MAHITEKQSAGPSEGDTGSQMDLVQRAESQLLRMLYFRRQYDQRRAFFYRQFIGQQDRRTFPDNVTPRSNSFVPYPLSNVETIVSRVLDAFFSFDPWFECKGRSDADQPAAEKMQPTLEYKLSRASLIPAFETLVRNICIYGFGGIKVDWDWGYDEGVDAQAQLVMQPVMQPGPDGRPQPVIDPQTGQPAMQPALNPATGAPIVARVQPVPVKIPRMRPRFVPIDIYDLLVDPDAGQIAHVTEKSLGQILHEQELSTLAASQDPTGTMQPQYIPEAVALLAQRCKQLSPNEPNLVIVRIAELWNEIDGTVQIQTFGHDREALSWKDLRASFRAANVSGYKRRMYGDAPILLASGPNPFAHKKAPILTTSFIKLPNEVFGLGAIEIISDLTETLNRFVNMIADNWNLGINRRYAYNVDADIDHASLNMFNVPGGKVGVSGNPNEVIAPLPFFTPQRGDYAVLDVYKGMIELSSGVSDFYSKGIGSPTNNKTGMGIASVMNESNFRFKMFIRNLEIDILQPLLNMCASMIQQYMTDQEEVRITDAPAGIEKWPIVKPEELIGNFDFELVAANYATNKVVRQRNLLAFANWASQTPYWEPYNGLKEIAKIFEVRNVNKLLKSPQQVQQEQAAQMQEQVQLMILESLLQHGEALDLAHKKAKYSAQYKPASANAKSHPGTSGRPRGMQQEGKIAGSDLGGPIREIMQSLGANGLGLSGLGPTGGTGG